MILKSIKMTQTGRYGLRFLWLRTDFDKCICNMTGDGENKRLLGLFGTSTHRDEKGRQIGKSTPIFWGGTDTKIDR